MVKKIAVVIFNLGGPDSLQNVRPFLFNLFNDKHIITIPAIFRYFLAKFISWKREKIAKEIYSHIGGKSPILQATIDQKNALQANLNGESSEAVFKVFACMRHWHPMSEEVVQEIKKYQPEEIILLPLYPQFSTTTTASSIEDFTKKWRAINGENDNVKSKTICCYSGDNGFIQSWANLIETYLDGLDELDLKSRMIFSAHGLPKKIVESGDPYQWQIEKTVALLVEKLKVKAKFNDMEYRISYQSRVGPLKWIGPNTEDEIKLAGLSKKSLIIVPIAFVSEHAETLAELDIEYKRIASGYGIDYVRVPTLGTNNLFIKSLGNMVRKFAGLKTDGSYLASDNLGKICPDRYVNCPCYKSS